MRPPKPIVDEVTPDEAYAEMSERPATVLVDVRSRAEWSFVGIPDTAGIGRPLCLVEWASFPEMRPNPDFVAELRAAVGEEVPERIFFICRSGQRSLDAAHAVARALAAEGIAAHCTNVAEGFEGPLDAERHRGTEAGWKARGLPWRQS